MAMVMAVSVTVTVVGALGQELQHVFGDGDAGPFHQFQGGHASLDRRTVDRRHLSRGAHPHQRASPFSSPFSFPFNCASTSSSCSRSSTT